MMLLRNMETLQDALIQYNKTSDNGIRIIYGKNRECFISYYNLYLDSLKLLGYFQSKGVHSGDELILYLDDPLHFLITFWASILGGIVPVPVSIGTRKEHKEKVYRLLKKLHRPHFISEKQHQIEYSHCPLFDIMDALAWPDPGRKQSCRPEDMAFIQFSSGSTGDPKGVCLTHSNLLHNIDGVIKASLMTPSDSSLSWMPLTHDMGLIGFHLVPLVNNQNQTIMPPTLFIKNPLLWIETAARLRATILSSPNFGYKYFSDVYKRKGLAPVDLSSIRLIFNGAEPVSYKIITEFLDLLAPMGLSREAMYPVYGLAEASLAVSFPKVNSPISPLYIDRASMKIGDFVSEISQNEGEQTFALELVDLGYPIPHCHVEIRHENNQRLEEGQIGYVFISGNNVTNGHYGVPLREDPWLNTGDIGFFRNDKLVIIGREKDILFINGQNYYAHDLESVLVAYEIGKMGEMAICGVRSQNQDEETILCFIASKIPEEEFIKNIKKIEYIILEHFGFKIHHVIPVAKIPKTTSGKIQRYYLGEEYSRGVFDESVKRISSLLSAQVALGDSSLTGDALTIASIWCRVLKLEKTLSSESDILALGAQSLDIIQISDALSEEFQLEIKFSDIVTLKTIQALVQAIHSHQFVPLQEIEKHDLTLCPHLIPLTNIQKAYWIGRSDSLSLGGTSTHFFLEIDTPYSLSLIEEALNILITHHDLLRSYVTDDGELYVRNSVPHYRIQTISLDEQEGEEELKKRREQLSHCIHDTKKWPLFEFVGASGQSKKNHLLMSIDLIIADALSIKLILEQLASLCEMKRQNQTIQLPSPKDSFREYVLNQMALKQSSTYQKAKEYWCSQKTNFPIAPSLPMKSSLDVIKNHHFKRLGHFFDKENYLQLQQVAKQYEVTPSTLIATLYAHILSYWSGESRFALNMTLFNRNRLDPERDQIVGDFSTTLPLVIDFKEQSSFVEKLFSVQQSIFKTIEYKDFDAIDFSREIDEKKILWPVVFTCALFKERDQKPSLGQPLYSLSQTSQVSLDFQVISTSEGFSCTWDYVEELFDTDMITSIFNQFIKSLTDLIQEKSFKPITISEKDSQFIKAYNDTFKERTTGTLQAFFKESAKKYPLRFAVIFNNESITYSDLDKRSDAVAVYLQRRGVKRGDFVAIVGHRTIKTITLLMGIMKSGAAYVPVNPDYPKERISSILQTSHASLLLDENTEIDLFCKERPDEQNQNSNDVAYVIFTSGSTGAPKGVVITHDAVMNTILDINNRFNVTPDDRFMWISSLCFDLSVYDIFGALSSGAAIVVANDPRDVHELKNVVIKQGVTIWNSVPSLMELFVDEHIGEETNQKRMESLPTPKELFSQISFPFIDPYSLDHLLQEKEIDRFKEAQVHRHELNPCKKTISLHSNKEEPSFLNSRRTQRQFSSRPVSFEDFSSLLGIYSQRKNENRIYYTYASGGGLYPIDLYIFVKEGRVQGVVGGLYFYNPASNALEVVREAQTISENIHFFTNKEIYLSSAFSIFYVFSSAVSAPKYGGMAYLYACLDTGIMVGNLTSISEAYDLGLCSIGDMDFEKINNALTLDPSQTVIHAVEVGYKSTSDLDKWPIVESSLRLALLSGDWIPLTLVDKIKNHFPKLELISLGGATEASIWSIFFPIHKIEKEWKSVPYGYPLSNQTFYVLRGDLSLCPVGIAGDLYIGGRGVALGYLNDPEKTKDAFIQHPKWGTIYKTGDCGVLHQSGWIEFMGRKDCQVKIRGYRVELGEIENVLLKMDEVDRAIVIHKKGAIYAYVTLRNQVSSEKMRQFLASYLPEYMIPSRFLILDQLPLSSNGKIDRKQLPDPLPDLSPVLEKSENATVKQLTDTQNRLKEIWADALGTTSFSSQLTLSEGGIDSIQAVKMANKIRHVFNTEFPIGEFFRLQTIEAIADYLDHKALKKSLVLPKGIELLRSGTSHESLFLFHAGSGEIEVYGLLANLIRPTTTVFALRFDKIKDFAPKELSIELLATQYASLIRYFQPHGPYLLAGWCVGGTLAFETARRLESLGEEVQFLALLNSLPPYPNQDVETFHLEDEKKLIESLFRLDFPIQLDMNSASFWEFVALELEKTLSPETLISKFPNELQRLLPKFEHLSCSDLVRYANTFRTFLKARALYVPKGSVKAPLFVLEATKEKQGTALDWHHFSEGHFDLSSIPTDHVSLLKMPDVKETAIWFNNKLNEDSGRSYGTVIGSK